MMVLKKYMNELLKTVLLLLSFALSVSAERRPNVIFIMADDVSAKEYSIYGGKGIDTPNLDRMAKEGVAFKTAWAVPQCAPTRAVLHTGQYACHTKWYGNEVHGSDLSERENILGKVMKRRGYTTAWFEKFHFRNSQLDPRPFGFDEYAVDLAWDGYDGPPQDRPGHMYQIQWYWHPGIIHNGIGIPTTEKDFGSELHANLIVDFIQRHRDESFFVYWPTFLPHKDFNNKAWAYTSVPELDENGNKTDGRVPGSLKSTLEYLDHLLGRILAAVEEAGLAEDTIVVFAGDNGTSPYGKCKFEDERGPRVPFVVWGPGRIQPRPPSGCADRFFRYPPHRWLNWAAKSFRQTRGWMGTVSRRICWDSRLKSGRPFSVSFMMVDGFAINVFCAMPAAITMTAVTVAVKTWDIGR